MIWGPADSTTADAAGSLIGWVVGEENEVRTTDAWRGEWWGVVGWGAVWCGMGCGGVGCGGVG